MQSPDEKSARVTVIRPTRLIKHPHQFLTTDAWRRYKQVEEGNIETQPTAVLPSLPTTPRSNLWEDVPETDPDADIPMDIFDVGSMSTMRLMEVSGMMRAV